MGEMGDTNTCAGVVGIASRMVGRSGVGFAGRSAIAAAASWGCGGKTGEDAERGVLGGGNAAAGVDEDADGAPPNGFAQDEGDDGGGEQEVHVIPLIAVDFGCAVWLEYIATGSDEKRLRFVSFPPVDVDRASPEFESVSMPGEVRTLDTPAELDLNRVSHIGIDQAQGAVILGLTNGQVYILRYR